MVARKKCTNPACAMRGTEIRTDRDECLGCGDELHDLFADLFGLDDLLGGFGSGPKR